MSLVRGTRKAEGHFFTFQSGMTGTVRVIELKGRVASSEEKHQHSRRASEN